MKHARNPPEQLPFIIILASSDGRRYRNVIMADDADEARAKASAMAAMLAGRFEVTHVRPAVARAATRQDALTKLEAMAAAPEQARGSDRAA